MFPQHQITVKSSVAITRVKIIRELLVNMLRFNQKETELKLNRREITGIDLQDRFICCGTEAQ